MSRLTALLCASIVSASTQQPQLCTPDELSSEGLTMAIDAALMHLQGQQGWFHGLRISSGYLNAMSVASCTPDANRWKYPAESEATGLLARVLRANTIRVAGVQWSNGNAANYKSDPDNPSGFWVDYLEAIVSTMSTHYGRTITIDRVYFDSSPLVIDAVATGAVDMSEPYYYLGGFYANTPRIESLSFSCIAAGLASSFYTKRGSGISSVDQLYDLIASGPNRAVGFIGSGNYDAVSAILPETTTASIVTNASDMASNVLSGALVAGYVSEGAPLNDELFEVFETGIVSPRVALFRKDAMSCTAAEQTDSSVAGVLVALIIVAAISFVLVLLVSYMIVRERSGTPIFMPLVNEMPSDVIKSNMHTDAL